MIKKHQYFFANISATKARIFILCGGQLLSCGLIFQISLRFVHICARTSCKGVRARFIAIARVYNKCARICAQILMKFETYAHKIVIYQHIKFHEDLSFRCRDIRKTILVFLIIDFQCNFDISAIMHLRSLQRWIITE